MAKNCGSWNGQALAFREKEGSSQFYFGFSFRFLEDYNTSIHFVNMEISSWNKDISN